jgi:diguanylate cyclase (GGDEF)-like protein/PAS domain S-box-containing protein
MTHAGMQALVFLCTAIIYDAYKFPGRVPVELPALTGPVGFAASRDSRSLARPRPIRYAFTMPLLDVRTVVVCHFLIALICTTVMAFHWRQYRGRYAGLEFWLLDYALLSVGLMLVAARGAVPILLSATGGNALIIGGFIILLHGLQRYFAQRGGAVADWLVFLVFVAAHAWFAVGSPDLGARDVLFSAAMFFVCGRCMWVLGHLDAGRRRIASGTFAVLAAYCLASLARIALKFTQPTGSDLFAESSFDSLVLVVYMALLIALTFSLVSMVGRRIYFEQERMIDEKTIAETALRASEEKFSRAFQASPDAVAISRLADGRLIEVNDGFCRITGYSRSEALGEPPIDVWRKPEAREDLVEEILGASVVKDREVTLYGKGGKEIHAELSGGIVELDGEKHILSIVRDLSERERADTILRVRLALHEYAPGHSTDELMIKALDEIEAMTGSRVGFYHFVDEERCALSLQAWSTRTLAEFCTADRSSPHYPIEQAGVWADCIRRREPIVHNDYASLPGRKGMPEGHAPIKRELVAPTMRGGRIVAVLGVGNKPSDYTDEDVALVSFMVDLVWTIVEKKRADERIGELNARLEQLALTDDLTGIANRRAFFALAHRELQKAKRYATPLSFVMVDIDRFKDVNDRWGHQAGDEVLKSVTEVMRNHVRDVDIPARLGGEEFGILMPNTKQSDAAVSAERLRAAIAGSALAHRGQDLRVTVSIGVAAKAENDDLDAVMRAADAAMYRAKALGRDRVETA